MKLWKLFVLAIMISALVIGCGKKEQPAQEKQKPEKITPVEHSGAAEKATPAEETAPAEKPAAEPEVKQPAKEDPRGKRGADEGEMGHAKPAKEKDKGSASGGNTSNRVTLSGAPTVTAVKGAHLSRQVDQVSNTIRGNLSDIQACYTKQKQAQSTLEGWITVKVTVKNDGSTTNVAIDKSNWDGNNAGKKVETCVTNDMRDWNFGNSKADCNVQFKLEFR